MSEASAMVTVNDNNNKQQQNIYGIYSNNTTILKREVLGKVTFVQLREHLYRVIYFHSFGWQLLWFYSYIAGSVSAHKGP